MKAKILALSLMTAFALTGCGEKHEKVHAVDKVEEAQAAALAKAPTAEAVKFADDGEAPMGGVGENGGKATAPTASATQATEANASATQATSAPQITSGSDTKQ